MKNCALWLTYVIKVHKVIFGTLSCQELEAISAAYEQAKARLEEKEREQAELQKKALENETQVLRKFGFTFTGAEKTDIAENYEKVKSISAAHDKSKTLLETKEQERTTVQKQLAELEAKVVNFEQCQATEPF